MNSLRKYSLAGGILYLLTGNQAHYKIYSP